MREIRASLLPSFGYLYPEGTHHINDCEDIDSLGRVLQPYDIYYRIFEQCIQACPFPSCSCFRATISRSMMFFI